MKKTIITFLFITIGFFAWSQIPRNELGIDTNVFPEEKVALNINSNILLAGEALLYKISILNNSNTKSELSKIAYVSLRNQNDSIIFNHKLRLENGNASANSFLPANLKTGSYRLIGYTNFSRNQATESFISKNIYIINTFAENISISKSSDTIRLEAFYEDKEELFTQRNNKQEFSIKTDKLNYGFREKVTLNIEDLGEDSGSFMLSVRQANPVKVSNEIDENTQQTNSKIFYIPELRGELISGKVISNEDNKAVANQIVSLTIPGKYFIFKLAKTDKYGRFFFSIPEDYESEKSFLQLVEANENHAILMDKKDLKLNSNPESFLKLDPSLKNWLKERSVQLQIENAYFDKKKDSLLLRISHPAFYNNLGVNYLLDDYTRFPTLRETFIEVIKLAAIRGSEKNIRFLVYNEYDPKGYGKFRDIPPLVLMDGMMIQNNEELINYSAMDIKSIRVVNSPYRYGPQLYSGIISLTTKKGDFSPAPIAYVKQIDLPPTVQTRKTFNPKYQNNSQNRIPDYRVQLLWEPEIKSSSKNITFYTSDVPGTFEILLEGFDANGKEIQITKHIKVLDH